MALAPARTFLPAKNIMPSAFHRLVALSAASRIVGKSAFDKDKRTTNEFARSVIKNAVESRQLQPKRQPIVKLKYFTIIQTFPRCH
jgi:hypothetical protein